MNSLSNVFMAASYKQTATIDLNGEKWVPLLARSYDGGNYNIENLNVQKENLTDVAELIQVESGGFLFVAAIGESIVQNINIKNATIGSESSPIDNAAAVVCGLQAYFSPAITIQNCKVDENTKIYASTAAGVVNGSASTLFNLTITNCENHATVNATETAAGITIDNANISNCSNYGNVTGTYMVGGIVPETYTGYTISNCHNYGNLTGTNVGGIAGFGEICNITACHNEGTLTTENGYVGGIIAELFPIQPEYTDITLTGCYNVNADVSLIGLINYAHSYNVENTSLNINLTSCYNIPVNENVTNTTNALIGKISKTDEATTLRPFTLTLTNCYYTKAEAGYSVEGIDNGIATVPDSNICEKLDKEGEANWTTAMTAMNTSMSTYQYVENNGNENHPLKLNGEPTE